MPRRCLEPALECGRVGLGTGSTVHHTILALGERRPRITCAATSERTAELATRLGLEVVGADEVDPNFNLVKGGGGVRERVRDDRG